MYGFVCKVDKKETKTPWFCKFAKTINVLSIDVEPRQLPGPLSWRPFACASKLFSALL